MKNEPWKPFELAIRDRKNNPEAAMMIVAIECAILGMMDGKVQRNKLPGQK